MRAILLLGSSVATVAVYWLLFIFVRPLAWLLFWAHILAVVIISGLVALGSRSAKVSGSRVLPPSRSSK